MATIKEIAAMLGLSSATISRALRNDETLAIAPETRARILMAAEQIGYAKKPPKRDKAQALAPILIVHKQQTFRNQIDSSYYFSVRSGIEDASAKARIKCSFCMIEHLEAWTDPVQGILLVGNYAQAQYERLSQYFPDAPTTAIGILAFLRDRIDHVTHSNQDSVRLALEHLFANGHQRIGYLGVEEAPGTSAFGSRRQVFVEMMQSRGFLNPAWIRESDHGTDRVERGYSLMKHWIEEGEALPSALFCANDPIALGAMKALHEAGIRVPQQMSIVAHDGSYPTQYAVPPLTTVDVHPYQLGVEGVHLLLEKIETPGRPAKQVRLYPELVVRESVSPQS